MKNRGLRNYKYLPQADITTGQLMRFEAVLYMLARFHLSDEQEAFLTLMIFTQKSNNALS